MKRRIIILFVSAFIFVLFMNGRAEASPKSDALKAYGSMLSKTIQNRADWTDSDIIYSKECKFAICYINNDDIPELIVNSTKVSHYAGYGRLYTYRGGKAVLVGSLDVNICPSVYPKTGNLIDYYRGTGDEDICYSFNGKKLVRKLRVSTVKSISSKYYYQISGKREKTITNEKYKKLLKKLTKGKKAVKPKFYQNTQSNRMKYLK